MKHIATITDKDIIGVDGLSTAPPRICVRAVLFDRDGNIALWHIKKWEVYMLPGGGVEDGEDFYTALKREMLEECGCDCEIIAELGRVDENSNCAEPSVVAENYCYIARVVGEKSELSLCDYEIADGSEPLWLPLPQAFELASQQQFSNQRPVDGRWWTKAVTVTILKEALAWTQENAL
ncbi:MAG: NUDIX domain-containing protein [Oscillospiraceae bacterium]|nr:NUDIX domain-containing protein [Oscillospiraceae bacterium]